MEQRSCFLAVDVQRFSDELILAARKEVIDGADGRTESRPHARRLKSSAGLNNGSADSVEQPDEARFAS